MSYSGTYKPTNPNKYEGDPTNIIYRSNWEKRYMIWLDKNTNVISWSSEEIVVPYRSLVDNKFHRYFVDFKVKLKNNDGVVKTYLVEIKPERETKPPKQRSRITKQYLYEVKTWGTNQSKWTAATEYCKNRGWEFIILNEHHLGIS